jgi:hypothetical protein
MFHLELWCFLKINVLKIKINITILAKFNQKKEAKNLKIFSISLSKEGKSSLKKKKTTSELLNFDLYDKMLTYHGALNPTSSIQRNIHVTWHEACHTKSKFHIINLYLHFNLCWIT